MFSRRKKCALLIDFDNVLGMTSGEFTTSIAKWWNGSKTARSTKIGKSASS